MYPADNDTALTARLASANGFDLAALPTNREGRLTDAQRSKLGKRLRASRRNSLVPKLGCAIAVVFLGYSLHTGTLTGDAALSVGFLAVVTGWVGFVMPHYGRFRHDVTSGRVVHLDGVVTRKRESGGDYFARGSADDDFYYVLDARRFRVSGRGYDALVEHRRYRIYYLPDARTDNRQVMSPMVNIEALPDQP